MTSEISIKNKLERDSNMELLRVISMLFILIHHFTVHVFYPGLSVRDGNIDPSRMVAILLNGFTYVGVNCFILISGYYGIRFKLKSLFKLYCFCAFYAILTILFSHFADGVPFSRSHLYQVFLPFSHTDWWFIRCYVVLFLLSPILNKAIESLGKKEFFLSLVLLFVINIYFGYYWHLHNYDGYNAWQFVFMYFIGAYLHMYPLKKLDKRRSMILYLSCALLWSILTIISVKWRVPHWIPFSYHNPLVVLGAVGLFVFISRTSFHNRRINALASTVLAAYLLQDVEGGFAYRCATVYKESFVVSCHSPFIEIIYMLAFVILASVFILGLAYFLERFRALLMVPVWKMYDSLKKRFYADLS